MQRKILESGKRKDNRASFLFYWNNLENTYNRGDA